tara:strand:+ start:857 stop:1027 length:171 start_codon:yes stop_codon:yes gene_type:complete
MTEPFAVKVSYRIKTDEESNKILKEKFCGMDYFDYSITNDQFEEAFRILTIYYFRG